MKKAIIIISSIFCFISLKSQNIECIGNTINIPLSGYKAGKIQWQFSNDRNTWINLAGKTTTNLQYNVVETGYFRAKVTYGQCDYFSDTTFIKAYPVPTASNAGLDNSIATLDTLVTLSANSPTIGKGKWTIVSGTGGFFTNDTIPNTTFKGNSCSDYRLRWTILTGCMSKTDDVNIGFHANPSISNAGNDISKLNEDTSVLLTSNIPIYGKGKWSIVSGIGGVFTNDTISNTIFQGMPYTKYVLRWTIENKCNTSTDDVVISFYKNGPYKNISDYEGNVYNTVCIGTQIWTADNIRSKKYSDGTNITGVWTYNESNVIVNGRVYDYNSIMKSNTVQTIQGVCPSGWHLPSDTEWSELINFIKNNGYSAKEGKALKSITGWNNSGNGIDAFGFKAYPAGYFHESGFWVWVGNIAFFWSSTLNKQRYINDNYDIVSTGNLNNNFKFSVRCIKD